MGSEEWKGVAAFLALPMVIIGLGLWYAFALTILWGWFVVPLWPDAPILTLLPAWGLSLVLSAFSVPRNRNSSTIGWFNIIAQPGYLLGVGAFINLIS